MESQVINRNNKKGKKHGIRSHTFQVCDLFIHVIQYLCPQLNTLFERVREINEIVRMKNRKSFCK